MKILLIQPPVQDFYDTDVRLQPLGLCYLKSTLKREHPDVEVILRDYHHGHGRRMAALPKDLSYLRDYYFTPDKSPFSTFYNYFHFGLSFDEIEKDILAIGPDVVGLSCLFTPYFPQALEIAERIKKHLPIPILAGGSHVSALPHYVLRQDAIDFIITGEGERSIVEFVDYLKGRRPISDVANLGFKRDGQMIMNAKKDNYPIDELPLPDMSQFDPESYSFWGKPMTFMITSRSCPHRCSFCSVHLTFGYSYRRRSIENVLQEIQQRFREGYRIVDFEDDNLTFYKNDMKQLCRELIRLFPNNEMQFVAMNGISYISLDDELLELMKQAGFTHLNLALVSSDHLVRQATKRPHTIEAYTQVVNKAYALGFKIVSYQILGLPNETLESMIQTLCFHATQPVLLGASMFYQTPNSPIAKDLELTEKDYFLSRLTSMAIETEHLKREQLYTLFICTRMINYLKSLRVESDPDLLAMLQNLTPHEIGSQALLHLLNTKELLAYPKSGPVRVARFDYALFAEVFKKLECITTQNGQRLELFNLQQSLH